jgi:hypothetical protein
VLAGDCQGPLLYIIAVLLVRVPHIRRARYSLADLPFFRHGIARVGARCARVLAVSLVAGAGRRLLRLLSPLLSAARPDKPMVPGSLYWRVVSGLSSQRLHIACCTMNANRLRTGSG